MTNNQTNTFAWSDGTALTPGKANLFAIRGQRGAVVARNMPHDSAALTLNGNLRIQANKEPSCDGTTQGVFRSIANSGTNQTCPCLCNGSNRVSLLDTPGCLKTCGDQRWAGNSNANNTMCGTGGSTSAQQVLNTCQTGFELLPQKSLDYKGAATTENIWYRMCQEKNTGKTATCNSDTFKCQGATPANAVACTDAGKGLTNNSTGKVLVSACSTPPAPLQCQYRCADGFTWDYGICKSNCTGGPQTIANGSSSCLFNVPALNHGATSGPLTFSSSNTPTNGTTNGSAQFKCDNGSISTVSSSCDFTCNPGFTKSGNSCIAQNCSATTRNVGGYNYSVPATNNGSFRDVQITINGTPSNGYTLCTTRFTCSN